MFFIEFSYFNTELRPETDLLVGNKDYSVMCLFKTTRFHWQFENANRSQKWGKNIEKGKLLSQYREIAAESNDDGDFGEEVIRKSEHRLSLLFTVAIGFFLRTNLTTRLYPSPKLRKSGAIPLQLVFHGMHRHIILRYSNYRRP